MLSQMVAACLPRPLCPSLTARTLLEELECPDATPAERHALRGRVGEDEEDVEVEVEEEAAAAAVAAIQEGEQQVQAEEEEEEEDWESPLLTSSFLFSGTFGYFNLCIPPRMISIL